MSDLRTNFASFLSATEAATCLDLFTQLKIETGCTDYTYVEFRNKVTPALAYKDKRIFTLLDEKLAKYPPPTAQNRIVVSGAGPVGLRTSIELALLGHHVTLFELRDECSRQNIIKTWEQTLDDMYSLGLKVYFPFFQKGNTLHMGTREIQLSLLKSCLLLGVHVNFNRAVCGILRPSGTQSWSVWTLPGPEARPFLKKTEVGPAELQLQTNETDLSKFEKLNKCNYIEHAESEQGCVYDTVPISSPNLVQYEFDSFVVAEGESSRLIRNLGFDRMIFRLAVAIGLVVNLDYSPEAINNNSAPERFLTTGREGGRMHPALKKYYEKGLMVEYQEYMQGSNHFLAMSTTLISMIDAGVVKERRNTVRESLQSDNINFDALRDLARCFAQSRGIPDTAPFSERNGVQLFDYSCKGLCRETHRWLESNGKKTLVLPAGDIFQNPYWPQGLGVNRGVHSGLDAAWAAHLFATGSTPEDIDKERAFAFFQMDGMNWLKGDRPEPGAKWTADPMTRYPSLHFVKTATDSAMIPSRYVRNEE